MVVNDCAHVMEDLIPYLTNDFNIKFIQRTRGLWSKTFGILCQTLKSTGDIYHVSFALQDAFLVDKLKHLDILHVHGSDVRWTIHNKKWGWIVRSNLKHAKTILYATPDLEETIKKYRSDAIYLPTPVKTNTFTPKTNYSRKPKVVHFKLPYENPSMSSSIPITVLERNVPYSFMPDTLKTFDIFIDQLTIPSFSKTCLEAMSCGLATIDYRHVDSFAERVEELKDVSVIKRIGEENRRFVRETHDVRKVVGKLKSVYENFCEDK